MACYVLTDFAFHFETSGWPWLEQLGWLWCEESLKREIVIYIVTFFTTYVSHSYHHQCYHTIGMLLYTEKHLCTSFFVYLVVAYSPIKAISIEPRNWQNRIGGKTRITFWFKVWLIILIPIFPGRWRQCGKRRHK